MKDLSVIILSYKNPDMLRTTLEAVYASVTNFNYEVIVVDNNSPDSTPDMVQKEFPNAMLIRNSKNEGFSKGNNHGIRKSTGRYVLLLNPDTAVQPNVFEECIKFMDQRQDIGVLGCKLIKGDGTLDLASRRSFPDPVNSFYRFSGLSKLFPKSKRFATYNLTYLPEDQEAEVDSVVGAFLMIRRSVMDKIGLLDEDFFMYGEDLDWCFRVKQAGYKVYYWPKVTTYHYKGQSSRKTPYVSLYNFHVAMWIFYKKHYMKKYPLPLAWLVYLGIWGRFALLLIKNYFKRDKYVSR